MLNRVTLIGRLTRDPELKYIPTGSAVVTFTVAVTRKFKKEETDFIDVVAWQKTAEYIANYGAKGRQVAVEGRLQVRSYEDKEGHKRKATEVVVDDFRFLDKGNGKSDSGGAANGGGANWDDLARDVKLEVELDDDIPF